MKTDLREYGDRISLRFTDGTGLLVIVILTPEEWDDLKNKEIQRGT